MADLSFFREQIMELVEKSTDLDYPRCRGAYMADRIMEDFMEN